MHYLLLFFAYLRIYLFAFFIYLKPYETVFLCAYLAHIVSRTTCFATFIPHVSEREVSNSNRYHPQVDLKVCYPTSIKRSAQFLFALSFLFPSSPFFISNASPSRIKPRESSVSLCDGSSRTVGRFLTRASCV